MQNTAEGLRRLERLWFLFVVLLNLLSFLYFLSYFIHLPTDLFTRWCAIIWEINHNQGVFVRTVKRFSSCRPIFLFLSYLVENFMMNSVVFKKFPAVFELWPKMATFDPRKPLKLAYFRGFWELYCSKLLQIWFVIVFMYLFQLNMVKKIDCYHFGGFCSENWPFFRKSDFLPVHEKMNSSNSRPDIKL